MKKSLAILGVTLTLSLSIIAVPRPAYAQLSVNVNSDFSVTSLATLAKDTITATAAPLTAAATQWTALKGAVLDPLAHLLAQAVLRSITASVVQSINGENGSAQFVQNLSFYLMQVGDRVGLAFISQFGSSINSPFGSAIAFALRTNYLQSSTLAGFFAANQCTLYGISPNINSYLSGNFNQGGWGTWFALTTQDQNNPYTLYQNSAAKLASVVSSAQYNQRQTLQQNGGFFSWCPSGTTSSNPTQAGVSSSISASNNTCYNADGTPAAVQTPGSVIHDSLSKVLGSGVDSLVSVHDFDQMADTILSALTVKVVSTGLSALSGSGSGSYSYDSSGQYGNTGISSDPNAASISASANSAAQTSLTQVANYTSSWQTIQNAATSASAALSQLSTSCSSLANDAQTALLNEVQPVLTQAQAALASAATTNTLALRVQQESSSSAAGSSGALASDLQTLIAAPPTATDIASAQGDAAVTGSATSTPVGSLTVSGGTKIDRMNLITANAQAAGNSCNAAPTS